MSGNTYQQPNTWDFQSWSFPFEGICGSFASETHMISTIVNHDTSDKMWVQMLNKSQALVCKHFGCGCYEHHDIV